MTPCPDCDFEAKGNSGLASHRRAKHPEPETVSVEDAVRRDLEQVAGAEGLRAAAIKLGAKMDESMSARDLPGLAAELRQTLATLGVVTEDEESTDAVDQLAARRVARFADAKDHGKPAAGG